MEIALFVEVTIIGCQNVHPAKVLMLNKDAVSFVGILGIKSKNVLKSNII